MKIQAQIVGDSLSPQGHRLTSLLLTFPRFILAELNTHRMLSKNTASSRAIPFERMLKSVTESPFVPIAWQKVHKGMQGTEYFTNPEDIQELEYYWRESAKEAANTAAGLAEKGTTKQLANRMMENYMWVTALVTGTEWENFFELRCPQYVVHSDDGDLIFRSKKDLLNSLDVFPGIKEAVSQRTEIEWLLANKGQAEIHMMALAEAMWDAMNESTPKQLKAGEWHIPFEDKISLYEVAKYMREADLIDRELGDSPSIINKARYLPELIKVSTAMGARTSYTVVGDEKEIGYDRLISIHDTMAVAKPFHASPFEHCAPAMSDKEYYLFFKGELNTLEHEAGSGETDYWVSERSKGLGWCRNYRGFIQYRHILEQQNK